MGTCLRVIIIDASAGSIMFTGFDPAFVDVSLSTSFALIASEEGKDGAALTSGLKLQPVMDAKTQSITDTAIMP